MDSWSAQLAARRSNVQQQSGHKDLSLLHAALQVEPLPDLEVPSSLLPADQLETLLAERKPHFVPVEDPSVDNTGEPICAPALDCLVPAMCVKICFLPHCALPVSGDPQGHCPVPLLHLS